MKIDCLYRFIRFFPVIILGGLIGSCSSMKYVPENNYLLNKVEMHIDNHEIDRNELKTYLKQKENHKILGFIKFHLWLYNLSSKKKEGGWLKKIGEEPQMYDEILDKRSIGQVQQYLNNKGYYHSSVKSETNVNGKKRKLDLVYEIKTGTPYLIGQIRFNIPDSSLSVIFSKDTAGCLLKVNKPFDIDILDRERERIARLFRNHGYYYFSKDMVFYFADSSRIDKRVFLDLVIRDTSQRLNADSIKPYRKYYINQFYFNILPVLAGETDSGRDGFNRDDTVRWDNSTLIHTRFFKYSPALLSRMNKLENSTLYNLKRVEETFGAFNRLRQFRYIDLKFAESGAKQDTNLLDCHINLAPLTRQSTSFDIEGTNTSGNFGIAGNLNYLHRNLFHGAEIFSLTVKGAMERQQAVVRDVAEDFNTREFGVESNFIVPKLLGPGFISKSFDQSIPKTVFTLGFNYQRRPDYTRTISNFKIGYDWRSSARMRQLVNIIDFNMVNLYNYDPDFINSIKDLYIKSSFTDHLIFAVNYSLIYNDKTDNSRTSYSYLKFSFESAGNLLSLFSAMTGLEKANADNSANFYRIFNTRFAQYLKTDLEFRKGYFLDKFNSLVGRAFVGVGLPYGNFDVLPFEKKYFTGGANGIRAWQVRSLGPGSYSEPAGAYPNQSSDIKLEINLEYRFKLVEFLEGALFYDAGNIWAVNNKDNREGALFRLNGFYRQIAMGTGAGLRFDFNYFIFRLDLGLKLRDPSQPEGHGWIPGTRKFNSNDLNLSFAIGYPF